MADVKWIKIVTDIFDDEKILMIETMPDADTIIVIWFKLLCLAGKQSNGGVIMLADRIPYTDEMLAKVFHRPLNTVRLALEIFQEYGMIEIIENVITIPNWSKHQSMDKIEAQRERDRIRKRENRKAKKLLIEGNLSADSPRTVPGQSENVPPPEEDEEGQNKNKELDIKNKEDDTEESGKSSSSSSPSSSYPDPVERVVRMYNGICSSLPPQPNITENQRSEILTLFHEQGIENIRKVFLIAEQTPFLRGEKGKWKADFVWLIKPDNFIKVLARTYDDYKD